MRVFPHDVISLLTKLIERESFASQILPFFQGNVYKEDLGL